MSVLSNVLSVGNLAVLAVDGGLLADAETIYRPFRPAQWIQAPLTFLTVPGSTTSGINPATGNLSVTSTASTMYVFDAVFKVDHSLTARKTQHPVQTGASIVDHVFIEPTRLVLEIGMSDSMDSYQSGMWSGSSSKSVNAFQELKKLQLARIPLTINTRLDTYTNMVIETIQTSDSSVTRNALRATVTISQLFVGQVTTTPVSDRSQDTSSTPQGATQGIPVPVPVTTQNLVPAADQVANIPGAGNWTSIGLAY